MNKIVKYIRKPKLVWLYFFSKGYLKFLPDEMYLKMKYKFIFKKELNLNNPTTFNEKLNYLKLNDRKSLYTKLADKILVKEYVSNKIGEEYVIPLYKTYENSDAIDVNELPNEFVLKCSHDSGGAFICKKDDFDFKSIKKKLDKNLKRNWFWPSREWPYRNIKPRILAEKYIEDPESDDLIDYKFLCFNGEPKYVYMTVKNDNIYENYYDMNFNKVEINHGYPRRKEEFEKPLNYDLMVELVKKLSEGIPFVRIDMHNINGKIYFGEYTFYDWAGLKPYQKEETDIELGKLLNIEEI